MLKFFIALIIIWSTLVFPLPTQSECIEGFHLNWVNTKGDPTAIVLSMIVTPEDQRKISLPLAGIKYSDDYSYIYIQYSGNCEYKNAMTNKLIELWKIKKIDLPKFEKVETPITPSPDTIDLKGRFWKN